LRAKRLRDAIESNNVPPYRDWMRFIKPRGAEQIVYGDKVICVRNHKRQPYIYATKEKGEREFLANGEIGMVVGQMQWPRGKPSFTQIEFAGRDDRNYSFTRSAFSEDGQPYLELAYAITVHKAQGSEFGVVMLILPSYSRLVSREMLYTALTRQKRRIWILHQGPVEKFLALRQYVFSDIAGRYTNLLHTPNLQAPRTRGGCAARPQRIATGIPRRTPHSPDAAGGDGELEERTRDRGHPLRSGKEGLPEIPRRAAAPVRRWPGTMGRLSDRSQRQELVLGAFRPHG
jgi:hypothetical protein